MIREVVGRSYDGESLPDLILIDGGRGQLDAALHALHGLGHPQPDIAALAKLRDDQPERVYRRDARRPIPLDPSLPSAKLLQRIRDEVHRFAISYHRVTRAKRVLSSSLEEIPGVGRARRLALLKAFGGMEQLKRASLEDIQAVKGIDRKTATRVFEALHDISARPPA
jgi:excinuclease ABC subunit C